MQKNYTRLQKLVQNSKNQNKQKQNVYKYSTHLNPLKIYVFLVTLVKIQVFSISLFVCELN